MCIRDSISAQRRTTRPALTRALFTYVMGKELKSEELRVLYVALTRAKERLILSGVVKKSQELFAKLSQDFAWYDLLAQNSPLEWVLSALLPLPCMADWYQGVHPAKEQIEIVHSICGEAAGGGRQEQQFDLKACLLAAGKQPYRPFLRYEAERIPVTVSYTHLPYRPAG